MSQRRQALGRIWTLLWQFTIGYVAAIIIGVVGALWAIADLLWQLVTGRNDLSENSAPAQWVSRALQWSVGQTVYGITGGGDGQWQPLP